MLSYQELKDKPELLLALTSLKADEFERLLPAFGQAWQAYLAEEEQKRTAPRLRKRGGGRRGRLQALEDKLLFILVYFKVYPLQVVQGQLFGLSQGQANTWIHVLSPLLQAALAAEQQLPSRDPLTVEAVMSACDTLDFVIDGTERRRQRPQDEQQRTDYYSGKKKTHTHKNNLIVNADTQQVVYLSPTTVGKTHDKKIADQDAVIFPLNARLGKDTGFQGYEPAGVITFQPQKSHAASRSRPTPGS